MSIIALLLATVIEPLWPSPAQIPDSQPELYAAPTELIRGADGKRSVELMKQHPMPYLEWEEKPANANGACCILISGGGYVQLCDRKAFLKLRDRLQTNGIQCVWLWYRVPRPKNLPFYQVGWEDGQRAVRLVRSQAAKRGYDPNRIGVVGCSAGSHLGLLLCTSATAAAYKPIDALDQIGCEVNFGLLHCPAYALEGSFMDKSMPENGRERMDKIFKFDDNTCPVCFFHGSKDQYTPLASTRAYRQLRRMKIPAELHLEADRKHGPVVDDRFERALEFLRQLGLLGKVGKGVELTRRADSQSRARCWSEDVWPKGKMPDAQAHQCLPYLEWHLPKVKTTDAIQIIYSGGAYQGNSPDRFEVAPMREYLNSKGMTVVTLKYRTPRPRNLPKHLTAWQDLQRTIRIVKAEAPRLGLDPERIGIMGSSAGGHLTLMGCLSSQTAAYKPIDDLDFTDCRVAWGVPIYPAYSLTDGAENPNSQGGNEDDAVPVPEFAFDAGTCPMVFLHGDSDVWAAMNSVKVWERARQMNVHCDLHTLATRGHCFQAVATPGTGSYTWMDRVWEFLTRKGFNK